MCACLKYKFHLLTHFNIKLCCAVLVGILITETLVMIIQGDIELSVG